MDRYCYVCGKECKVVDGDGFDSDIGTKNKRTECPSNICEHKGIYHNYEDIKRTGFFKFFKSSKEKCTRCGDIRLVACDAGW